MHSPSLHDGKDGLRDARMLKGFADEATAQTGICFVMRNRATGDLLERAGHKDTISGKFYPVPVTRNTQGYLQISPIPPKP